MATSHAYLGIRSLPMSRSLCLHTFPHPAVARTKERSWHVWSSGFRQPPTLSSSGWTACQNTKALITVRPPGLINNYSAMLISGHSSFRSHGEDQTGGPRSLIMSGPNDSRFLRERDQSLPVAVLSKSCPQHFARKPPLPSGLR